MIPLRIGILGAADIAPRALVRPAARRDDMNVVAVASRSGRAAERFAREHGIPASFEGYASLLDDDDIDLVYIALPPSEHARWSIAAMQAGKDVLCEKPIAMSSAEARMMGVAAADTGRHLIEAFHDHYHPLTAHLLETVRSGALGTITSVEAVFTADNPFRAESLRHDPALGGGALMDLGCYPAHWLREIGGAEPVVEHADHIPNELGADMSIGAELSFSVGPAAGAHVSLRASMGPDVPFSATVTVRGDRGSIHVDNLVLPHRGHSVAAVLDGVATTVTVAGRETYDHELDGVAAALSSGRPADTEAHDFVPNMALLDAIYRAAGVMRPSPAGSRP